MFQDKTSHDPGILGSHFQVLDLELMRTDRIDEVYCGTLKQLLDRPHGPHVPHGAGPGPLLSDPILHVLLHRTVTPIV